MHNPGWNAVPDSTGYWLEIGQDSVFQQVVDSRWGLQRNSMETAFCTSM